MSEEDWTTTVPTQELIEMSLISNDNLQSLRDIFDFEKTGLLEIPQHVFYIICEITWLESSLLLILRRDLVDPKFYGDDQKEVIIAQTTLQSLATLNIAKFHAVKDLNSYGYSLDLN